MAEYAELKKKQEELQRQAKRDLRLAIWLIVLSGICTVTNLVLLLVK